MAEIVNLRRARKAKAKSAREAEAEANRIKHGAPKRARADAKAREQLANRRLDATKIETDEPDDA